MLSTLPISANSPYPFDKPLLDGRFDDKTEFEDNYSSFHESKIRNNESPEKTLHNSNLILATKNQRNIEIMTQKPLDFFFSKLRCQEYNTKIAQQAKISN